jgi:hypothetical protein
MPRARRRTFMTIPRLLSCGVTTFYDDTNTSSVPGVVRARSNDAIGWRTRSARRVGALFNALDNDGRSAADSTECTERTEERTDSTEPRSVRTVPITLPR